MLEDAFLRHLNFVVFDLETTGFDNRAQIVEIAAVRLEEWQPVAEFHSLVNPGIPIPARSTAVHEIDDAMVRHAPTFAEIAPGFAHLMQDAVLVGHNIFSFDLRFLLREMRRFFGSGPNNWAIDTLLLARRLISAPKHKLGILAEMYDIPIVAHQAMSDVYANAEIWLHLASILAERRLDRLPHLQQFKSLRRLDGSGLPRFHERPHTRFVGRESISSMSL